MQKKKCWIFVKKGEIMIILCEVLTLVFYFIDFCSLQANFVKIVLPDVNLCGYVINHQPFPNFIIISLIVCLSDRPSIGLSIHPSIHRPVCLSACLSIRLSVSPSVRPSIRPSVRSSVHHILIHYSIRLFIHLSINTY